MDFFEILALVISGWTAGYGVNTFFKILDVVYQKAHPKKDWSPKNLLIGGLIDAFHHLPLWAFITFVGLFTYRLFPIGTEGWVNIWILSFGVGGVISDLRSLRNRYVGLEELILRYIKTGDIREAILEELLDTIKKKSKGNDIDKILQENEELIKQLLENNKSGNQ